MYTYIIICYIWIYNTYIHVNTSSGTCIPVKSWGWDIHQMVRAEVNTRSSSLGGVYQFNESTLWFWTLPLFPILLEAHSWNMKKTEATNEICMSHQRYQCNKFRQIQGPYPQGWEEIIVDQLTLRFCRVFFGGFSMAVQSTISRQKIKVAKLFQPATLKNSPLMITINLGILSAWQSLECLDCSDPQCERCSLGSVAQIKPQHLQGHCRTAVVGYSLQLISGLEVVL